MSTIGTLLAAFCSLIFYGKIRLDFVSAHIFIEFILVYPPKLKEKKESSFRFVLESCADMPSPPQFSKGQLTPIRLLKYIAFK